MANPEGGAGQALPLQVRYRAGTEGECGKSARGSYLLPSLVIHVILHGSNGGAGSGGKKFKELNDQERTDWYKRDPAGFETAAAADRRVF